MCYASFESNGFLTVRTTVDLRAKFFGVFFSAVRFWQCLPARRSKLLGWYVCVVGWCAYVILCCCHSTTLEGMISLNSIKIMFYLLQVHLPSLSVFANWPTHRTPLSHVFSHSFSQDNRFLVTGNDRGHAHLYR